MFGFSLSYLLWLYSFLLAAPRILVLLEREKPEGGLYLASKAAFALSHFWKAVDGAKEIPEDTLKKEAGRTPLEAENEGSRPMHVRENHGRESVHWDRENGFGLRCRR